MTTHHTTSARRDDSDHVDSVIADAPEQLTLLAAPSVPLQFRLDERTRRSGLQHVAALRAQMEAQAAARHAPVTHRPRVNSQIAA